MGSMCRPIIVPHVAATRRTVESLRRYCDLTVTKMATVSHLGFLEIQNFNRHPVWRMNMRHHAKLRADRSNYCRDTAVFQFFKMAAVHHLDLFYACLGVRTTNKE